HELDQIASWIVDVRAGRPPVLAARLDRVPLVAQTRKRVVVAIDDHGDVTGAWASLICVHQVDLGGAVLKPYRAARDARWDGDRFEAEELVEADARLEFGARDLLSDVMDHVFET